MDDTNAEEVGKIYGNLKITRVWRELSPCKRSPNRTIPMCEAECLLCGSVKSYRLGNLRSEHHTTSCGCKRLGLALASEIVGKRFGRLTVVERTNQKDNKNLKKASNLYRCRCDCGKERLVTAKELKSGKAISCGCSKDAQQMLVVLDEGRVEQSNYYQLIRKVGRNNTSGVKGVYWVPSKKRWMAAIGVNGETIHLGAYHNIDEAIAARKEAEEKYHKPLIEEAEKKMKGTKKDEPETTY